MWVIHLHDERPTLQPLGPNSNRVAKPWSIGVNRRTITVPPGFLFDIASVPRPLWPLISPRDLSVDAALLHDFLYHHGGRPPAGSIDPPRSFTRSETDTLFRLVMRERNIPRWRRTLAYLAVRLFGFTGWKTNDTRPRPPTIRPAA